MRDTHGVGLISHTAVLNRLVQLEYEVLLPWASHLGYDMAYYVVEEHRNFGFFVYRDPRLVRIQVKTGRLINDLPSGGQKMSTMTLRFKEYGLLLGGRYGTKRI
jgi:hypothetical protein